MISFQTIAIMYVFCTIYRAGFSIDLNFMNPATLREKRKSKHLLWHTHTNTLFQKSQQKPIFCHLQC